jgi:integrating conjugative element protein (TIGR03759 family)
MKKISCRPHYWAVVPIAVLLAVLVPVAYADQVESSDIQHSQADHSEAVTLAAARWKISEEDYRRYQEIIKGPLSRWNPAMDPVLVLGLFAESDSEQQRFAELYAMQEHDLTRRTLEFERVYREAFTRLFPDTPVIDKQLLQPYYNAKKNKQAHRSFFNESPMLKQGDRLLYFPANDCTLCGQVITRLKARLESLGIVMDIYIRQASTKEEVRQWAAANGIAVEWISEGLLTLNIDNGLYQQLRQKTLSPLFNPTFFLNRNDTIFDLDEKVFKL